MGWWLRTILVFLLLGMATAIGVAWIGAVFEEEMPFDAALVAELRRAQWDRERASLELRKEDVWIYWAFRGRVCDVVVIRPGRSASTRLNMTRAMQNRLDFGWPRRCMTASKFSEGQPGAEARSLVRGGFEIDGDLRLTFATPTGPPPRARSAHRLFPLHPLFGGLAFNTVCFAAAWMLLWFVPRLGIHAGRVMRGRCPRCGYPIGRTSCCSECGGRVRALV